MSTYRGPCNLEANLEARKLFRLKKIVCRATLIKVCGCQVGFQHSFPPHIAYRHRRERLRNIAVSEVQQPYGDQHIENFTGGVVLATLDLVWEEAGTKNKETSEELVSSKVLRDPLGAAGGCGVQYCCQVTLKMYQTSLSNPSWVLSVWSLHLPQSKKHVFVILN